MEQNIPMDLNATSEREENEMKDLSKQVEQTKQQTEAEAAVPQAKRRGAKDAMELVMHIIFLLCGIIAVAFVLFISIYLIISGLPAIQKIGLWDFLFGQTWAPTHGETPQFGILPFILTSIYGTAGALIIGVPVGLLTAIYLATALKAVPKEYEEASLALGATKIETIFRVSLPAAKSGVATAIVLGVGRAIGEAMAIIMVSGNVANMPDLFGSVRFLTTAIASEMSYASVGSLQRDALFSIGLVLFLFIMLINVFLNLVIKRKKEGE